MRRLVNNFLALAVLWAITVAGLLLFAPGTAHASYNSPNLMSDSVFTNTSTMSVNDIQNFLNAKNSGLKNYHDVVDCGSSSGSHYSYYVTYYSCGQSVLAAKIIYDASQAYGINPQVILATLQKEQSLITAPNPTSSQLNCAMGYNSCGGFVGFFNQVDNGTWQFRTYIELMNNRNWWGYTPASYPCRTGVTSVPSHDSSGNNHNFYYPGLYPNQNVAFYDYYGDLYAQFALGNSATAALYCYTPHVYPGSSSVYYSGSYNFVTSFEAWFGSVYGLANDYAFVTSSATALHYNPGGTGSATIVIKNTGNNTWYSDNNLPADQHSTRLATIGYQNSPFINPDASSLYTRNQVLMTPDVVAPGQNATFTFNIAAPYQVTTSHLRFVPIVNGTFLKDIGMDVPLFSDTPAWNPISSSVDARDLLPNQQAHAHFVVQNNSASTWYSDSSLPTGKQPTRLATIGYKESSFADTTDPNWLGTRSQIKMNEASVAPGQTATFDAWFIAPISSTTARSAFHFIVIVGGVFTQDKGLVFNFTTPAANLSFVGTAVTNPPASMSPGQVASTSFTVKNTGNVVWQDEQYQSGLHALRLVMTHPQYRSSAFYDSSDANWLSIGQIKKSSGTTMPGGTATFTWNWKAPVQTGSYHEPFQLSVGGTFYPDYGSAFNTSVQ